MTPACAIAASIDGLLLIDDPDVPAPEGAHVQELYLEVRLNRSAAGQLARFVMRDGRLFTDAGTLRHLGLAWPGGDTAEGPVALDTLPGLHSDYDPAEQRLHLTAPVELLSGAPAMLGYAPPPPPRLDPATRTAGLLLNYDLYAQGDDSQQSVSGWHELRLFGAGPGTWRNSALMQFARADGRPDTRGSVRLDTYWQLDLPDPMVSVTVGDTYGSALDWTRTTRFGGIRVSRNFALQPYRVTIPLASFTGEAALPSTVDLFINGIRQAQQQVAPGRFQIDSAPVLNGVGQAQVVITDINGQSRTVGFSLYNARQLLQAGLGDWSFEAGKLRRDYGLRSFSYADDPMASASFRYGATDFLTLETHAEATRGLEMGGAGASWLLGRAGGILGVSYAASRHQQDQGRQHGFGYQWQGRRLSLDLSTLRRDRAFRDVASLEGATLPLRTDHAFVGLNAGAGQFGASYLRQDPPDAERARYASLSWSRPLKGYGSLNLSVNRDLEGDTGTSGYLYWSLPLGRRHHAWASAEHRPRGDGLSVGATRSLPADEDGWGWRAQASVGEQAGGQAELTRLTRFGQWRIGALHRHDDDGTTTGFANASGGLLLMQGRPFPMRRAYDAFALVSTDGIADVPVMLENRPYGRTDRNGLLLVTPLNAWQDNDLSIDPLVLPADISIQRTRMAAVPATGSGMLARFPMRAVVAVQLSLRDRDGQWIPAGTTARVLPAAAGDDGQAILTTVGHDGFVYLQDPPAGARLSVQRGADHCSATLPDPLPARGWIDLGEMSCH